MNGLEKRRSKRVPVALRIKLRYREVDTFVSKFATNISATGIFISSRKPKSKGTQLRFELRLADDSVVIAGRGRVSWVLPYDKTHPKAPHGMGIEFTSLNKGSRELVERIVETRIEQGLGENEGIPYALQEKDLAQVVSELKENHTQPSANVSPEAVSSLMPSLAEVPDSSEGGIVVELSLDDIDSSSIDLQSVLRRAKKLVGDGEVGAELSELFKVSAAPVAETVDDASNKLATILGGNAVYSARSKDRGKLADSSRQEDPPKGSQTEDDVKDAEVIGQKSETSSILQDLPVGDLLVIEDDNTAQLPAPPTAEPFDVLAGAIHSLEQESDSREHSTPLDNALAGLEQDQDITPATVLAISSFSAEEEGGSVDYILDDDALSELEIIDDDDDFDLPDIPKSPA